MKAYQLENGIKFITDYPNDEPSDDNISFEEDFYRYSSQSISQAYEDVVNGDYSEIEIDDIESFGQVDDKEWLQENYSN